MTRPGRRLVLIAWLVVLALAFVAPFYFSDYDLFDMTRLLAIAFAVAGLNLLIGHSGQVSVGHGAIFGVGGYTALIAVGRLGWPWWMGLALAILVCLALGLVLGLAALKMGGGNLGLLTIAVAAIFPLVLIRAKPLTGGNVGIYASSPLGAPEWTGLTTAQFEFLVVLISLALVILGLRNLTTGRYGRALAAIRTSPLLAVSAGIPVNRIKLTAFTISSVVAGIGGAYFAYVLALAVPDSYLVTFSIALLSASVVGGVRTWAGALIGSAIIVYLPTLAESVVGGQAAGNWSQLVYALGLALCLIFAPHGLAGSVNAMIARITRRRSGDIGTTTPTQETKGKATHVP
jgi:branched-chain amino acid transport system permease protein